MGVGSTSGSQGGNSTEQGTIEWGGLYLRSEAELRIAKAIDQQEILFFANARGRVSLLNAPVSNDQSNGRVEADFMIFHQRKCLILEVDGQHHLEGEQATRDYARDRMLLRAGLPTVRFTGRDCIRSSGCSCGGMFIDFVSKDLELLVYSIL